MSKVNVIGVTTVARSGPAGMVEVLTALAAIVLAIGARLLVEMFFPNIVAFPFIFPAVAVATLLAGWRSGLIVVFGCQILTWYFLVPVKNSFVFATSGDAAGLAIATAAQLVLLFFVARYRQAERATAELLQEQGRKLEQSLALLRSRLKPTSCSWSRKRRYGPAARISRRSMRRAATAWRSARRFGMRPAMSSNIRFWRSIGRTPNSPRRRGNRC